VQYRVPGSLAPHEVLRCLVKLVVEYLEEAVSGLSAVEGEVLIIVRGIATSVIREDGLAPHTNV
jgi:hypothetical protein